MIEGGGKEEWSSRNMRIGATRWKSSCGEGANHNLQGAKKKSVEPLGQAESELWGKEGAVEQGVNNPAYVEPCDSGATNTTQLPHREPMGAQGRGRK